jgi:MerR family transcriptional regulator, mercuric resistance operon regulatory protein
MNDLRGDARPHLGIGDVARLGGCTVDTVRYYERIGLLPKPERSEGGQRRYGEKSLRQLLFIRRLRDLGFRLDQIENLLSMVRQPDFRCAAFRRLADAQIAEIRRRIGELRRLAGRIALLAGHCATAGDSRCDVLDALWDGPVGGPGQLRSVCCRAPANVELSAKP